MADDDEAARQAAEKQAADADAATNKEGEGGEQSPEELEAFARRLGWRSEEDFQNLPAHKRPKNIISATDFIDRVQNELPILRDRLFQQDRREQANAARIEQLVNEVNRSSAGVRAIYERMENAEQRGYEKAMEEFQAKMDQAAATGDVDAYHDAKQQRDAKQREAKEAAKKQNGAEGGPQPGPGPAGAPPPNPVIDRWVDANRQWFVTPEMQPAAAAKEAELMRTEPHLSLEQRLERVADFMIENFSNAYPHYFQGFTPKGKRTAPPSQDGDGGGGEPAGGNPRRQGVPTVGGGTKGGGGTPKTKKLTYSDLNEEEKAACDYLVEELADKGFTREKYLENYARERA